MRNCKHLYYINIGDYNDDINESNYELIVKIMN